MNLRIFGGSDIRMLFFLLMPLFEFYLRDFMYIGGRVINVTPLNFATPTFYCHAHNDFSMIWVDFCIHRSRIDLQGFQIGRGFCGSGLVGVSFVGMALASKASYGHAHRGHAHEATPTKDLDHLGTPEDQFSIDGCKKIHWNMLNWLWAWL